MFLKYHLYNIDIKIKLARSITCNSVVIFNYHQIASVFDNKYHNRWTYTDIHFFEKQIIWLKQHYQIIPLHTAIEMANQNAIDNNYACITFDDGDKSIINIIQLLEKHSVAATFFINSGYLDNQAACWINVYRYLQNSTQHNHLITQDIKEKASILRQTNDCQLYNQYSKKIENLFIHIQDEFNMFTILSVLKNIDTTLFNVASHGFEHQRFAMMDAKWQQENILKDLDILSKLASYQPIFAIPFGRPHDWTIETLKICMQLGLEIVFADGGINNHRQVGYNRIPADGLNLARLIKNNEPF